MSTTLSASSHECLARAVTYESCAVATHLVADIDRVGRSAAAVDAEGSSEIAILSGVRDLGDEHALRVDLLHVLVVVIIWLVTVG